MCNERIIEQNVQVFLFRLEFFGGLLHRMQVREVELKPDALLPRLSFQVLNSLFHFLLVSCTNVDFGIVGEQALRKAIECERDLVSTLRSRYLGYLFAYT